MRVREPLAAPAPHGPAYQGRVGLEAVESNGTPGRIGRIIRRASPGPPPPPRGRSMTIPPSLRTLLARFQDQGEAHLSLDDALDGLSPELRGVRPTGLPHSVWELVEHIRIAQRDILEFSTAGEYQQGEWPESYWPPTPAPPDDAAWSACLVGLREDREALRALASDPDVDLSAPTPHANRADQTHLRALLLAQDHAAYHIGQVVLTRKLLEAGS